MIVGKTAFTLFLISLVWDQCVECQHQKDKMLSRKKRYVSFPEGASFSAVICLTLQMGISDGAQIFSEGINWGLVYNLPNDTKPLLDRYAPAQKRRNRRELYNKVEDILNSMGYNGRSCMLRSLCESENFFKAREDSLLHHVIKKVFRFPKEPIMPHEPDDHRLYHWAASIPERSGTEGEDAYSINRKCADTFKCPFSLIEIALGYYSASSHACSPTIFSRVESSDRNDKVLSRDKRWLVWKEGVNWVAIIFGIGIPVEVNLNSVVLGSTMKAYYLLPDNSSIYTNPSIEIQRKRRTASRWGIYQLIETYLERSHYSDGKACLLKAICQVAAIRFEERSGLLAEIAHTLLTPSTTNEALEDHSNYAYHFAEKVGKEVGQCHHVFPECSLDPVHQFSRLMSV